MTKNEALYRIAALLALDTERTIEAARTNANLEQHATEVGSKNEAAVKALEIEDKYKYILHSIQ